MKSLTNEIEKALLLDITFTKGIIIDYAINKRGYDFEWDYLEGIDTLRVFKNDKLMGIVLAVFPIAFIHKNAYDDFKDLHGYHLVMVDSFTKEEWELDVDKMRKITPKIVWTEDDDFDTTKMSIIDFELAVQN